MLFCNTWQIIIAFFIGMVANMMFIKIIRTKRKRLFQGIANWIKTYAI
jgi:hypothetical protein